MDQIEQAISPELREAVRRFGFHKVAAKMYGVSELDDVAAARIIGTKLAARLAEWRSVSNGLTALRELEKNSADPHVTTALLAAGIPLAAAGINLLAKPLGYAMGRAQVAEGEPHSYGVSQTIGSLLPGGGGYQEGRFMAHATRQGKKDKE